MLVYKGCRDGMVVTLKINRNGLNNLERNCMVDPDHAMFRCQKAEVVAIESVVTKETAEMAISGYDEQFCYRVGEMVEEPEYRANIEIVRGKGIHFFLTEETAKFYALCLMNFVGHTGEFKSWHDTGQQWERGQFKDGEKDGEWEWCDDNGQWHDNSEWKNGMMC